jgi:putative aldouronate transport system permease protein
MSRLTVKRKISFSRVIIGFLLILLGITTLYPFWYIGVVSLSSYQSVVGKSILLWPLNPTFEAYEYVLTSSDFLQIARNTFFVVGAGTVLSILTTIFFAYGLAKKIPGYRWFTYIIFFTLLFGGGMIPTYLVVRSTHLLNSLWSLIIPNLANAFYIIMLRNFFLTIPDSLEESASLDGANVLTILFRIILPVSMPGITTIALFYGVGYWNSFFDAILYISSRGKWVLQVLLRELLISNNKDILQGVVDTASGMSTTSFTIKMATVMVASLPILLVYPFIQKYFIKGAMVGAVKG